MAMRRGWLALVALVAAGCGAVSAVSTGPGHPARGDGIRYDDASRGLHAAHFPRAPGWRTRISEPSADVPACGKQRVSWASTVPFLDGPRQLPPSRMIEALPPDGIIMAVSQYVDTCRQLKGIRAVRPPLDLAKATRSGFPGPRGDELPLYRILGRFAGRYELDLWVFYGRRHPTPAQRAAAQRELSGVRWPAPL
jgi:hypothetical protein